MLNAPGRKGCGRVTIIAGPVEGVVEGIVLQQLLLSPQGAAVDAAVSQAEVSKQREQRAEDQAFLEQLDRDH